MSEYQYPKDPYTKDETWRKISGVKVILKKTSFYQRKEIRGMRLLSVLQYVHKKTT